MKTSFCYIGAEKDCVRAERSEHEFILLIHRFALMGLKEKGILSEAQYCMVEKNLYHSCNRTSPGMDLQ